MLFQSHGEPPAPSAEPLEPGRKLLPSQIPDPGPEPAKAPPPVETSGPELSDAVRGALLFTAYDLDVRVTPVGSRFTARARVTVRNRSELPLPRIALQVSSALRWESVGVVTGGGTQRLTLAQHLVDTDADHTGKASEAVLELPSPLAPGASLTLDGFYSGAIVASAERLSRIGASETQGAAADWDAISAGGVFLRGFGNVLWYPVSAPQVFLGDGSRLFEAADRNRLAEQASTVRLRLSVEYRGDPPAAAYFCGRRAAFTAISDTPEEPVAASGGLATAEFAAAPLGFRVPSLFVIPRPEELVTPEAGGEPVLAVASPDPEAAAAALREAAGRVVPLLQQWLGVRPLSVLTVLDHPGQPFADGPLLVAPLKPLTTPGAEPALTASLAHAWVQTGRPWVDEGLAQFFALLEVERARGREAMVAQLGELLKPLVLPDVSPEPEGSPPSGDAAQPAGEPLLAAASEVYYRRKAAAVWLMLREIVGDQALQVTLAAWRLRPPGGRETTAEDDARLLEDLLEKNSGKELRGLFEDWVLHDRGLPDLTVAEVTPRPLPLTASGRSAGWLTVVTVHNAGAAMADVPLVVSAGSFSTTVRIVVPAEGNVTARVQTESAPTEVQVNDGITPEMRTSVHRRAVRSR